MNNVKIEDILKQEDIQTRDDKYNKYVKKITPTNNVLINLWRAFIVGGFICIVGQFFTNMLIKYGVSEENAKLYNIVILVGLSALFTGFGLYSKIVKYGGAGAIVPITGFANSVASTAIEFKKEGQVFGIGCKIFNIAGPVILYGVLSSWVLGILYFIISKV